MHNLRDDSIILEEIKGGNKEAFRELAERYSTPLFRLSMGYLHSKEDAEDMVQEIFVKLYHSLDSFKGDSKFSTWLYRIAVNTCLNEIARRKRRDIFTTFGDNMTKIFNHSGDSKNPEEQTISEENKKRVRKAIESLPEKQQTAFVLQKYKELSQKEIAEIMQISEGAVEQHLVRAKSSLQKKLKER
ncbi:MAG: RNA polymerase sigma factor [Bacteroidetes bacterium HGW-Bacteroidetes-7]|jgi:RNA polymerase sigma-70 factor (ECF subfamily)|nr:MAG: RNA polymerase sigma factor [Bacteroidetes bacterium HGW-Bacteroidetes-7]